MNASPPRRDFVGALWEGATRPSLTAAIGIPMFAFAQLAVLVLFLTPALVARVDAGYLMGSPWDQYGYATAHTIQLEQANSAAPSVVVLGASATRHLFEDHREYAKRLAREVGRPVELHFLVTADQTVWESAAILDHVPERFRGVVLIGVQPSRLVSEYDQLAELMRWPRLGLRSPSMEEVARARGLEVRPLRGIYFLDNLDFLLARRYAILRNVLTGPQAYALHGRRIDTRISPEEKAGQLERIGKRMAIWEAGHDENLELLARTIERLAERPDLEVVVFEAPLHPLVKRTYPDGYARYRRMLEERVARLGVVYVDLGASAALRAEDFHDMWHLSRGGGRERSEDVLAELLVPRLRRLEARTAS